MKTTTEKKHIAGRLKYLRGELRAERISYAELAELQSLAKHIQPGDVELLEAAGVPEFQKAQANPTPGKWRMSTIQLHNPERYTLLGGEVEIARIEPRRFSDAENEANANLIAAAPDLLQACKEEIEALSVWICSHGIPDDVFDGMEISRDKLQAAISKAKGNQ